MKKVMTIFGVVLIASMIMLGCSQKPEDIKLSDLETACDYIDAMEKCIDAGMKITNNNESEDLSQEVLDYLGILEDKLKEIMNAGEKKYTVDEVKECPNFEMVIEKLEKSGFQI